MLIAIGQARAKEGSKDLLVAAAAAVVAATRDDSGCEMYSFGIDVNDPEIVLSVEIGRDRESVGAHMEHQHTQQFLSSVSDLVAEPPTISFFTADSLDFAAERASS